MKFQNIFIGDEVFEDAEKLSGLDLLVVSSLKNKAYLEKLLYKSAFEFNGNELNIHDYGLFSTRGGFISGVKRFLAGDFRPQNIDANRYVRTSLSWRGFLSLISPFDSDNIAVVVTATDEDELSKLSNDLDSDKVNKAIGGDISIISGIDKVIAVVEALEDIVVPMYAGQWGYNTKVQDVIQKSVVIRIA